MDYRNNWPGYHGGYSEQNFNNNQEQSPQPQGPAPHPPEPTYAQDTWGGAVPAGSSSPYPPHGASHPGYPAPWNNAPQAHTFHAPASPVAPSPSSYNPWAHPTASTAFAPPPAQHGWPQNTAAAYAPPSHGGWTGGAVAVYTPSQAPAHDAWVHNAPTGYVAMAPYAAPGPVGHAPPPTESIGGI
ncbi:MAG TPA: hypothetical protein VFH51_18020, partial [Myxococcota bacterium]|nr:hypothetical protein [Myxococcota bacterium]